MAYTNTYTIFELSGFFPEQDVKLWNCWSVVTPQNTIRREQIVVDSFTLPDGNSAANRSFNSIFGPAGPTPTTFMALSIQDTPLVASNQGWLFRSGRLTTLPTAAIEIVTAPATILNQASINDAIANVALPVVTGTTSINAVTATLTTAGIDFVATGTDSRIPGITLTYSDTSILSPNSDLTDTAEPLELVLINPILAFIPGPGAGFAAAILNLFTGCFLNQVNPMVRTSLKDMINTSILSQIATRFSMGTVTTLPPGVIASIRRMTIRTNPSTGAVEIQLLGALGAFGGVFSAFPPVQIPNKICFIATASTSEHSPEVILLRRFRELQLRRTRAGRAFIKQYERLSPPLASLIQQSSILKYLTATLLIKPIVKIIRTCWRSL